MIKRNVEVTFSNEEITLILKLISQANFPVKDIELLYNLIIKLQNYVEKNNSIGK